MVGRDLVALAPLGSWMDAYGIVPVCSAYLLHVPAPVTLGVWVVLRLTPPGGAGPDDHDPLHRD